MTKQKRGRGRPRGSKNKTSLNKAIQDNPALEAIRNDVITLTCSICGRIFDVNTNNKELYTPEVKEKWTCGLKKTCLYKK